ncbi:MAG: prolipoprotein diacylglyceryl transferase family protein, partial [Lutispora sp.]
NLPWGIMVDGIKVHPTFLYESIWNLSLFLFLILYRRNKKFNGEIFLLYGIIYSIGRFWIEGLRTDSLMFMGMRTAQIISILIIILGLFIYFNMRRRSQAK